MRIPFAPIVIGFAVSFGAVRPAVAQSFTDHPLTAGMPIKAVHVTELRLAIAALRAFSALPTVALTDSTVTPALSPVRAIHIVELRHSLDAVFDAASTARPSYTDPTLTGVPIKAIHVMELRSAIVDIVAVTGGCVSDGGAATIGATHCGTILGNGDVDQWTFTATAGDRIAIHIGETTDVDDFRPRLQLLSPSSQEMGDNTGTDATAIDGGLAPTTGTYVALVSSSAPGGTGTGAYRLTIARSGGPIAISAGDQGGPMSNGALHTGEILQGDLDVWTFNATAGHRINVLIGETAEADDFRPWIRLWAPDGTLLGVFTGTDAASIDGRLALVTGTYLVLVGSADSGLDGAGAYRLTMTHSPGPITVSPGDQGGPLGNGTVHGGEILQGDLDVWSFDAAAGSRIGVQAGETSDTDDFRPWVRVWAPNGDILGDSSGTGAALIDGVVAPVTGTYLVLVGSFDAGFDGTGEYLLNIAQTSGPIAVSPGDQGGALGNGAMHTGDIAHADLDAWTFTAAAGSRIAVHVANTSAAADFRLWIRLWTPNGAALDSRLDTGGIVIDSAVAPVTGTYLVLVASFDNNLDSEGSYRLTVAHTPGPIEVPDGDEGGPLVNGVAHTGTMLPVDVDVWAIPVNAGAVITVNVTETLDDNDFRPWIRLWAPNGAVLGTFIGLSSALIPGTPAPVTGTYLVLVASFDAGFDGTGAYQLTVTHVMPP